MPKNWKARERKSNNKRNRMPKHNTTSRQSEYDRGVDAIIKAVRKRKEK